MSIEKPIILRNYINEPYKKLYDDLVEAKGHSFAAHSSHLDNIVFCKRLLLLVTISALALAIFGSACIGISCINGGFYVGSIGALGFPLFVLGIIAVIAKGVSYRHLNRIISNEDIKNLKYDYRKVKTDKPDDKKFIKTLVSG